jgi:copper chaperone CopZ
MSESTYTVQGMTCNHCAGSVSAEVSKLVGVTDVSVDVQAGVLTVTSDQPLPRESVTEAVTEAGYQVVS